MTCDASTSPPRNAPILALVAATSALLACGIGAVQARPLGDQPLAMLCAGGVLALGTSASCRTLPALWLGLTAMAGFPIWAAIDLARNGGHTLLPFELFFYAVYAVLGVVAASIGRIVGARVAQ